MTRADAIKQVPAGWRVLAVGETIKEGDKNVYLGDAFNMSACRTSVGYGYGDGHDGFNAETWLVLRKCDEPQFKVGDKVNIANKFGFPSLNSGVITAIRGKSPTNPDQYSYIIDSDTPGEYMLTVCVRDELLTKRETIAGHDVTVEEGGLKVGCTFVSDEDIKKAAKLRNII